MNDIRCCSGLLARGPHVTHITQKTMEFEDA